MILPRTLMVVSAYNMRKDARYQYYAKAVLYDMVRTYIAAIVIQHGIVCQGGIMISEIFTVVKNAFPQVFALLPEYIVNNAEELELQVAFDYEVNIDAWIVAMTEILGVQGDENGSWIGVMCMSSDEIRFESQITQRLI